MQLIARIRSRTGGLRDESGFTMFAVVGAMLAVMMLSVAAFATVGGDQESARHDQDTKRAFSAAEAGIQYYLSQLNEDNAFWAKCDQVPLPAVVNQPWDGTGADPRKRMKIPGSGRSATSGTAEFALEVLPAKDPATGQRKPACDPNDSSSMIDTQSGTFQIRSTGFVPNASGWVKRSVIATFRKKGFLDFLYFTDLETANPVTYRVNSGGLPPIAPAQDVQQWATNNCSTQWQNGRSSAPSYSGDIDDNGTNRTLNFGCTDIVFASGDRINGPLHTNDQMDICGTPTFGRTQQDAIEAVANPGWRGDGGCGGDNPQFTGTYTPGAGTLGFPPSNSRLKQLTDPAYVFTGKTDIQLTTGGVIVNGNLMPMPPNGLIFVQNGTCGVFYDPIATEKSSTPSGCGDAYVHGDYASDLTITAEKDIVVDGDIKNTSNAILGLIANNFVRVNHPVLNRQRTWNGRTFSWDCQNDPAQPAPNRIDAAILALQYSFIVDNWYCGAQLGNLTVNGAIAQKFRGIVGLVGYSGYLKDYNYDDRLRFRQPPNFLDPVQTAWRVMRQVEQTPPR